MTGDEIYKAILQSITQVRDVHAPPPVRRTLDANDCLLDEMARNAAQVLSSEIEARGSMSDQEAHDDGCADPQVCCLHNPPRRKEG